MALAEPPRRTAATTSHRMGHDMKLDSGSIVAGLVLALWGAQAAAGPREDVMAAFEKAMARDAYRATSTTDADGSTVETLISFRKPGSFHMRNPQTEVIVLPEGTWMKSGGEWMQLPMDMSSMIQGMTLTAMKQAASLIQQVEARGSEAVAGCDSTLYAYRTEGKVMGINASADVELAVCDDTGLPIRVVSSDPRTQARTTLVYDYDTPVEIRAPR